MIITMFKFDFLNVLLWQVLVRHFNRHGHLVGCVSHLNATDAVESTQPKKLFFFIPGEEGILSASCTQCKRILPLSIDLFLVDVVVIDVVNIEHFLLVYYFWFFRFIASLFLHNKSLWCSIKHAPFLVEKSNWKKLHIFSHFYQVTFYFAFLILKRI